MCEFHRGREREREREREKERERERERETKKLSLLSTSELSSNSLSPSLESTPPTPTSCGADSLGRPVIYSVLSLARGSRDVSSNTQHMTSVFEGAIRMLEHQKLKTSNISATSLRSESGGASPSSASASARPSPAPSASSSEGNSNKSSSNEGENAPPQPLVAEQWIWVSDMHGFVSFFSFFFPS